MTTAAVAALLTVNTYAEIEANPKSQHGAVAQNQHEQDITDRVPKSLLDFARQNSATLYARLVGYSRNEPQWRMVDQTDYIAAQSVKTAVTMENGQPIPMSRDELHEFIRKSGELQPDTLILPNIDWRLAVRTALVGGRLMFRGDSGYGKTITISAVAAALGRPCFIFNLGTEKDARSFLFGNTHFDPKVGTFLVESPFLRAIQTPGAMIGLDEAGRALPEVANALLPPLSEGVVHLNEDREAPPIFVASGVSFFATRNEGNLYTTNRDVDRAFTDRFIQRPITPPPLDKETALLHMLFPLVDADTVTSVAKLAHYLRTEMLSLTPAVSDAPSTRNTVEMCRLLNDGFTLPDAIEAIVYPLYPSGGGEYGPLTFARQQAQRVMEEQDGTDSFTV